MFAKLAKLKGGLVGKDDRGKKIKNFVEKSKIEKKKCEQQI